METKDSQEWDFESGRSKMSISPQLTQHNPQVLSGKPNAVTPRLQLPHENVQSISGVYTTLSNTWSFSSYSPILWALPPKSMTTTLPTASYIALDHIDVEGKILPFAKPILAKVSLNENGYVCQDENLGIVSMAVNLEDCFKDFKDEVLFIWNEYGKEDDNSLTSDAKELKRRILSYVKQ